MKAVLVFAFVLAVLAVLLGLTSVASADGSVNWEGHGSENLPCEYGGHWVLTGANNATSATLVVNGASYTMHQSGNGSWSANSSGPLDAGLTASASWSGSASDPSLQLSHCVGGSPTNTPPTETPVTPTVTETPVTNTPTPTSTSTTPGPSPTSTATKKPHQGPTATLVAGTPAVPSTGGSDGYWPIFVPVAALGLLFLALSLSGVVGKRR
jgi:hypothetical protein